MNEINEKNKQIKNTRFLISRIESMIEKMNLFDLILFKSELANLIDEYTNK